MVHVIFSIIAIRIIIYIGLTMRVINKVELEVSSICVLGWVGVCLGGWVIDYAGMFLFVCVYNKPTCMSVWVCLPSGHDNTLVMALWLSPKH